MWHYGTLKIGDKEVSTSWKSAAGRIVAADLPAGTAMDAKIVIDDAVFVIRDMSRQVHPDRVTFPLVTQAEMDALVAAAERDAAKARAEFEGKPWPHVAEKREAARGKSRQG